jgi:hypothetical protein
MVQCCAVGSLQLFCRSLLQSHDNDKESNDRIKWSMIQKLHPCTSSYTPLSTPYKFGTVSKVLVIVVPAGQALGIVVLGLRC